jgi:hypothetical protein
MTEILWRGLLHFICSCGIVLIVLLFLSFIHRRTNWIFLPEIPEQQLFIAALIVFAVSTMREAYDVSNGQPLIKAFTDYASWLLGCGFSVFGIYRVAKEI